MEELKPCPFCGGKAKTAFSIEINKFFVGCISGHCGEIADSFNTEEEAIKQWNTRSNDTLEPEKVVREKVVE